MRFIKHVKQGIRYLSPLIIWIVAFSCATTVVMAQDTNELDLDALLQLDLRQLMNIDVSLASRIEEKQFRAPAAVYVLTQEDIRRSGHRRLPEILRMVPGLHVAKIDANKWAVSSRNNQSRFTSTMNVMIDGRSVYTPFFAGVYWDSQDTFIEDIERIEVVRGPGGSLWGSNAVDGIINIITKSSADTHGTKAYALAGQGEMEYDAGVRYGGELANGINYRIFAKGYKNDNGEYLGAGDSTNNGLAPIGSGANDKGDSGQIGFRMDWSSGQDNYMLQGNAYDGDFDEDRVVSGMLLPNALSTEGYNLVMNWKRKLGNNESISVNAFYDQVSRDDEILLNDETTFDIDLQHNISHGEHNIAWGLGYRYYDNEARITSPSGCSVTVPCFGVDPEARDLETWSAFIQDRIAFTETFALILGSKFEHNDYTGFEYQPTLRGLWTPDNDTTYWGAVTRAVRVPDRVSTDGILDFGAFNVPIGNKDQQSFKNYAYELGFRKRLTNTWVVDGSFFYSDYRDTLQGAATLGRDYIFGFEGYVKHQYSPDLRLELGYTYNKGENALASGGDRSTAGLPRNSLSLRSYYNLKNNMDLDAMVYFVDESEYITGSANIPAYTRVDLRYGWRPVKQLDVSLLLTNLLDDAHAEAIDPFKINTGAERGVMLKFTYTTDR